MKTHIGDKILEFVAGGNLVLGICNGFQTLVNLGLLPGFDRDYQTRAVALTFNDCGNFRDQWVHLKVNPDSPCVFTKGMASIDLPVRHGEGKFYAPEEDIDHLLKNNQIVIRYADENCEPAKGQWPQNPNGSLKDIAGICDPTGRVFGLMPHPEGFNHPANHPNWTRRKEQLLRQGKGPENLQGKGVRIFRNAVDYVSKAIESGELEG